MTGEFVFPSPSFTTLREKLLSHSPKEAGAVLLCTAGVRSGSLLVRKAEFPSMDALRTQTETRLVVAPEYLSKIVKEARTKKYSVVLVHTHPFSEHPEFSHVDDEGERQIMPALFSRVPDCTHGSLVLGNSGFSGRLYSSPTHRQKVTLLREIGANVDLYRDGVDNSAADPVFDRTVRTIGAEGQALLRKLKVGIVGLGGTGSLIAQQLAYLGIGEIVLLDYDKIELTNVNRVVGATRSDVKRKKVAVAARMIEQISSRQTKATQVYGSLLHQRDAAKLFDCDFLFGCTDTHGSRAVLNQLAYQYLIPAIDMGVRIDASAGRITAMAGRVQMLAPGLSCLQCQNLLDPELVRRDLMTEEERKADPYIVGDSQPQPAVISLNSTVSSLAVTMFLSAVTGFPVKSRRSNYLIGEGTVRGVSSQPLSGCIVCSADRGALATGNTWPMFWRKE